MLVVKQPTFRCGSWNIDFNVIYDNRIYFTETDTSKFYYEKGYKETYSRIISKKGTIFFKGYKFDVSKLVGVITK